MLEDLEELVCETFTDEQRKAFAVFLKDVQVKLEDEEDIFYRPFIMSLVILQTIFEDEED